jgi:hypothetical protein
LGKQCQFRFGLTLGNQTVSLRKLKGTWKEDYTPYVCLVRALAKQAMFKSIKIFFNFSRY